VSQGTSSRAAPAALGQPCQEAGFFCLSAAITPSFRTEQADFFFRFRSSESVGLRREKSLFLFHRPADVMNLSSLFLTLFGYAESLFCNF
jgi:hypothetical protein